TKNVPYSAGLYGTDRVGRWSHARLSDEIIKGSSIRLPPPCLLNHQIHPVRQFAEWSERDSFKILEDIRRLKMLIENLHYILQHHCVCHNASPLNLPNHWIRNISHFSRNLSSTQPGFETQFLQFHLAIELTSSLVSPSEVALAQQWREVLPRAIEQL